MRVDHSRSVCFVGFLGDELSSLKRRVKRIRRVPDARRLPVRPYHRDDIKSSRRRRNAIPREVITGGLGKLVLLHGVNLRFGRGIIIGPGFDFDKYERLPLLGDYIQFAHGTGKIPLNDFVTVAAQESRRGVFAARTERVVL
jgi:hypothetical protein